jgi:hypothetical protein
MKTIFPWSPLCFSTKNFFDKKTDQNWPFFQQKLQFSMHFQLKNKHFSIKFFACGAVFFVPKSKPELRR